MTADLSPAERTTVERFDAAPDADESLRVRVARAVYDADPDVTFNSQDVPWNRVSEEWRDYHRMLADAAIAVMRGEQ